MKRNGVTLGEKKDPSISILDLKCGEIAEVVKWGAYKEYEGMIVQRYKNVVIPLGRESGRAYTSIFTMDIDKAKEYRVRVLDKGEQLVIS